MRSYQESVVREIRMLRLRRRVMKTERWDRLIGHETGNGGYRQARTYNFTASSLDPT